MDNQHNIGFVNFPMLCIGAIPGVVWGHLERPEDRRIAYAYTPVAAPRKRNCLMRQDGRRIQSLGTPWEAEDEVF
jgi:hypothetical protein